MQEFSNFENLQFVKNTKFSKFFQNLSFYYRDLRLKTKLLQFIQRITKQNLAEIGEPMVPTFGGLANIVPSLKCVNTVTYIITGLEKSPQPFFDYSETVN
jgi:hypothetical protein